MSRHQGFTLLNVLVLLLILTMVLLAETRYSAPKDAYASLSLTAAQTQMLLNDAFAYRGFSGDWDHSTPSADCILPQGNATNAFGQPAFCYFPDVTSASSLGNRVGVVQWIPTNLEALYESHFGNATVQKYGSLTSPGGYSPPNGYVGVVVFTDSSGGSLQKIDTFSLANYSTTSIPKLQCSSSNTLITFAAMSATCAHVYTSKKLFEKVWTHFIAGIPVPPSSCKPFPYPKSNILNYMHYLGFELLVRNNPGNSGILGATYNFYRKPIYPPYGGDWSRTMEVISSPRCAHRFDVDNHPYQYSKVGTREDSDGMINADNTCNSKQIETAIFQLCH